MAALPDGWDEKRLAQLAEGLREAAARPSAPGYLSRWLHAPKYTDFFIDVAPGGEIDRVEISFAGHLLLWQRGKPLLTGQTDELNVGQGMPQSRFVREHSHVDERIVNAVRILLAHLPDRALADKLVALLA